MAEKSEKKPGQSGEVVRDKRLKKTDPSLEQQNDSPPLSLSLHHKIAKSHLGSKDTGLGEVNSTEDGGDGEVN